MAQPGRDLCHFDGSVVLTNESEKSFSFFPFFCMVKPKVRDLEASDVANGMLAPPMAELSEMA